MIPVETARHRDASPLNSAEGLHKFKFWRTVIQSTVCSGNGFAEIERAEDDTPIALHYIHWRSIRVKRKEDGSIVYYVGEGREIPARDMLHFTTLSWDGVMGISPIRAARESLGISVAAERYAGSVYGNGGTPRGFLKVTGAPSPETKANIRESWDIIQGGPANANKVGILSGDTDWVETNMTPEDSQPLNSRTFQIEEVSRIFGVPSNLLFSGNQGSYNANEESNAQWYGLSLRNFIENIEAELDAKLLTREERFRGLSVKYRVDSLLRGSFKGMTDAWSRLVLTGIATQNEAREALGLNPVEGASSLFMPVNMAISSDQDGKETIKGDLKPLTDGRAKDHVRDAFLDSIGRVLRRQAKGKPDRSHVVEALGPTFRAYAAIQGHEPDVEAFADRWMRYTTERQINEIKSDEILGLVP